MLLLHNTQEYANALKNAYRQFPAKDSTLDIDFINNRQRVAGIYGAALGGVTFTRSTTGTYFDATGTLQTAAINAPRFDYDPISLRPLGLLIEESRANILLNSATGTTQSVTVSATAYTLSFYGTGTVTLSGASTAGPLVGTGANNRVSLTFTPTAGTLTLTVSGTVTKWQLEAGSFATSYIQTAGTAVTRGADVASMMGANFSSWYNQTGGVIIARFSLLGIYAQQTVYHIGRSSSNDRISIRNEDNILTCRVLASETPQVQLRSYALQANVQYAHVFSTFSDDFLSVGNGIIASDLSGAMPVLDYFTLGSLEGTVVVNAYMQRFIYIPKRLFNNLLQYLSRPNA